MIDIHLLVERKDYVQKALAKKDCHVDLNEVVAWIKQKRELLQTSENLKAERNRLQKEIGIRGNAGQNLDNFIEDLKEIKVKISKCDPLIKKLDADIFDLVSQLPNLPDDNVAGGGKENNTVIRTWSSKPEIHYPPRDHIELSESLKIIDYQRGAKIGGRGMWVYKDKGAILEWALLNYFIREHLQDGYTFLLPPHILNEKSGFVAGQFPKFKDDVFSLGKSSDDNSHFLLPTAETALVNYHRDELLNESMLPAKYFAYTPCYRREAGSYRSEERGMIRGHQFNKVELFQYTQPDKSEEALFEMLAKAETLVQALGLHYQVSQLAAEDCSASMKKTYDVEVWIPSMGIYKEVTSASNAGDYQARRGNMKFKNREGKNLFVHTLNASGLATSRVLPAILEQHQKSDGSVTIPEVLRPLTGFDELSPV